MFEAFFPFNTALQLFTAQVDLSVDASCSKYFQTEFSCFRPLLDLNFVLHAVIESQNQYLVASNTKSIAEPNFNFLLKM